MADANSQDVQETREQKRESYGQIRHLLYLRRDLARTSSELQAIMLAERLLNLAEWSDEYDDEHVNEITALIQKARHALDGSPTLTMRRRVALLAIDEMVLDPNTEDWGVLRTIEDWTDMFASPRIKYISGRLNEGIPNEISESLKRVRAVWNTGHSKKWDIVNEFLNFFGLREPAPTPEERALWSATRRRNYKHPLQKTWRAAKAIPDGLLGKWSKMPRK